MNKFICSRRRRRNPIKPNCKQSSMPLAARILMRRFNLMPGVAAAMAAADMEVE